MQYDQRFSQSGRIACIKGRVPLLIFLAKANHHNISLFNAFTGAHRIQLCAFVIVPKFVGFCAQNGNAAIITSGMIRDRAGKHNIKVPRTMRDLIAPICMNFTR